MPFSHTPLWRHDGSRAITKSATMPRGSYGYPNSEDAGVARFENQSFGVKLLVRVEMARTGDEREPRRPVRFTHTRRGGTDGYHRHGLNKEQALASVAEHDDDLVALPEGGQLAEEHRLVREAGVAFDDCVAWGSGRGAALVPAGIPAVLRQIHHPPAIDADTLDGTVDPQGRDDQLCGRRLWYQRLIAERRARRPGPFREAADSRESQSE